MGLLLKKCAASRRREPAAPSGLGRHATDGITPVGVSQPSQRADLERVGDSRRQVADDRGRPRGNGFVCPGGRLAATVWNGAPLDVVALCFGNGSYLDLQLPGEWPRHNRIDRRLSERLRAGF